MPHNLLYIMNRKLNLVILKWTLKFFFPKSLHNEVTRDIKQFLKLIDKYQATKGLLWTIKRLKLIRLISTKYIAGEPIKVYPEIIGIASDGFPKAISFLQKYADGTKFQKQLFLTLMTLSRTIVFKGTPDYSSITSPFKGTSKTIDQSFVNTFVNDFDLHAERGQFSNKSFLLTIKAGPLGHSLLTSLKHYMLYSGLHLQHIIVVGGPQLMNHIRDLKLYYKNKITLNEDKSKLTNRKLSIVYDPEAKARIIGIVDYLTQVILQPFSQQVFNKLKTLEQDRTFTQDPFIQKVPGNKFHSLDLSSATDRFPIEVQKQLLTEMVDKQFAYSWSRLMIAEPFLAPNGERLRYEVGQPMGARSSWAVFTLSHHMVVQYAAFQVGVYPFKDYILLGDDIVIANDKVAGKYREIMEQLGVDISSFKTHTSENTYEFAKRWFQDGVEITGIPLNSFITNIDKPFELFNSVFELYKRGYSGYYLETSVAMTLSLLSSSHNKYNFPKKIKYMEHLLENFRIGMVNLSGNFDYNRTREIWAKATKLHEGFPLPNESTMLLEYNRVGSAVVSTMILSILNKIEKFGKEMIQNGPLLLGISEESYKEISKEMLKQTPNWRALELSLINLSNAHNDLGFSADLMKTLQNVSMVNIEALSRMDRSSIRLMYQTQKFSTNMYKQLEFEPEYLVSKIQSMRVQRSFMDTRKSLGLPLRGDG